MPWYQHIPFFSIVGLMAVGILTSALHNGPRAMALHLGAVGAALGANLLLLGQVLPGGERFLYQCGIVGHPFGNELAAGPLEALLASVFLAVMLCSVLGGGKEVLEDIDPGKQNLYFVMCDLLTASLLAMVYTNDAFTAYVFIEINTISACALVMARDTGATLVATIRYLIMSLLGSGLFLMGLTFLYHMTGHLLLPDLHRAVLALGETGEYALPLVVTAGMLTLGLALKSALFPFHSWLPDAHGAATTASSAILSGLVLKGYIVLLVKVMAALFGLELFREMGLTDVLLVLGGLAMVIGSLMARKEGHIKRMVAWSTVAQIGYIYLGLGLGTEAGIVAALFQLITHAGTKSLLFLAAGRLSAARGHSKQLYDLRGVAREVPLAGAAFTLGGLSMVGLPLLGGFAVKFYLAGAGMEEGWRLWAALGALALSSLLNALYYIPAIFQLWSPPEAGAGARRGWEPGFALAALALMASVLGLGLFSQPVGEVLLAGLRLLEGGGL